MDSNMFSNSHSTTHPAALVCALVFMFFASLAAAQPVNNKHATIEAPFEEVFQDLRDAIINRGLQIDYTGHVDKMLERTSQVAGSVTETGAKSPYLSAKYIQFCSAKLTHESVSANPYNLAICPYVVFIFEARAQPGTVIVGYREPAPGPSKRSKDAFAKIDKLLNDIITEATTK
jgi:uncharacterized protein (DUF302 family)